MDTHDRQAGHNAREDVPELRFRDGAARCRHVEMHALLLVHSTAKGETMKVAPHAAVAQLQAALVTCRKAGASIDIQNVSAGAVGITPYGFTLLADEDNGAWVVRRCYSPRLRPRDAVDG